MMEKINKFPIINIIIAAFNAEKTLKKCVISLEKNSYKEICIIIVNDCSTDGTQSICEEIASHYKNITLLKNKVRRGVSYSRNRGLNKVKEGIVIFVDSDDFVDSSYIENLVQPFLKFKIEMSVSGYKNIERGRKQVLGWPDAEGAEVFCINKVIVRLYKLRMLQQLWNKAFLSSQIKENNLHFDEELQIGEDFKFVLEYIDACVKKVAIICDYSYNYVRLNSESLLLSHIDKENVCREIQILKKMCELSDLGKAERNAYFLQECENLKKTYAYNIVHRNMNFSKKVLLLIQNRCLKYLCSSYAVYIKEKIYNILKRECDN